jgi:hypothetical protein
MDLLFNNVLIKFDEEPEEIEVSGVKLKLDTSFNKMQHQVTTGMVMGLPHRLYFDRTNVVKSVEYDVDMELEIGDRVIMSYLSYGEAIKNASVDECHYVRYDEILVAMRGDQVIPLNGLVLIEPINMTESNEVKEVSKFLILPDYVKIQKSETRGIVRYKGKPVKRYLLDRFDTIYESEDDIQVGDYVYFSPNYAVPLQYDMHKTLPMTLYRMRRKDIQGVYQP